MELNGNEKRDLQTLLLAEGYQTYNTDYFESYDYEKLRTSMFQGFPSAKDKRLKFIFCPKSEVLKAGKYVIDKHFSRYDLRVLYANGDDLETQLYTLFGSNPTPEQYDEIIEYIKNNIELVRVTDVPIQLNTNSHQNGSTVTTRFYGYNQVEPQFYEKLPPCLKEINIAGACDESSKTIYVHEMCHALLFKNKGSVKNLLNSEALSIFMEKVAALDLDDSEKLLSLTTLSRLIQIKRHILDRELSEYLERDPLDVLTNKTYIISSLHATALFDLYIKGSRKTKKEIDDEIGHVIMGDKTIEDIFDHYEATLEKGSKIMKRQIKIFS